MKKGNKKTKTEIVFHLIKRISHSDKRYFKLINQAYKIDKGFLKLFDYLNVQEELNLSALEKFFEKKNIKNPGRCIQYLQDKIINSLQEKAAKSLSNKIETHNENIKQYLSVCSVYLYVDLPELGLKELRKAEKAALQLENYRYLLRIYQMEKDIIEAMYINHGTFNKLKQDITEKLDRTLKQLLLINEIEGNTAKIIAEMSPDAPGFQDAYDKIQEYAANAERLPVVAQQDILKTQIHYCYLKRDYRKMIVLLEKSIILWEAIPYERWDLAAYIDQWGNLLMMCVHSEDFSPKLTTYFNEYDQLPQKHPLIFEGPTQVFQRTYFITKYAIRSWAILRNRKYEDIHEMEQELMGGLTDFTYLPALGYIVHIIFLRIALIHLIFKNYDRSNYWLNQYLEFPKSPKASMDSTYEMLVVIQHHDRGDYVYLESKIRNLKRKWQKEKPEGPNTLVLLELIQQVLLKSNQHKIPDIWKTGLEEMYKAEISRSQFFINLSRWVETKIQPA